MNIDTDLQFAYTEGVRDYVSSKIDYLGSQIGNPEGSDEPNKILRSKKMDQGRRRHISKKIRTSFF